MTRRIPTWLNVILATSGSLLVLWRFLALMDTQEEVFRDPRDRARIGLGFVQRRVDSISGASEMPSSLDAVLSGLPRSRKEALEFDPWQRRIAFRADSTTYELRSSGPDSTFGSDDDIVIVAPRKELARPH